MAQLQEVFLFQPTSISACSLWLDAADSNTITSSGGSISQWRDKSSSGLVLAQATSANQPTLGPLLNNLQTIQFTTAQTLVSTGNLLTNPAQSWFTVFNAYNNVNSNRFFLNHSSNIGVTGGEYFYGGNGTIWANIKSGNLSLQRAIIDSVGLGITPFNSGQWYNTNIVDSNNTTDITSYSFRIDGSNRSIAIFGTNSNILTGTANINLFINNSPSANVYISEIIFYNAAIPMTQVQQIEGYLAWKWGLVASLPSNHPYKTYRPLANQPIPNQIPIMPTVGQNTPVFNPASISGCQLWLDAGDPTSFSLNGSTITQWRDKSGNGRNATASGGPVLQLNSINGLPSIFYDGIAGGTFSGSISITTTSIFAFAVFVSNMTGSSEGMRIISFSGPGCSDWNCSTTVIAFLYDTNRIQTWRNSSTTTNLTCPAQGSTILTTTYYDGSTAYNSLFGGTSASAIGSSGSFNISNYAMTFGNVNMKGNLGEVIIYNSVLTTNQRQQIEGYLAWKWGVLSSLPANHPYRVQPVFPLSSSLMSTKGSLNTWLPTRVSGCTIWLDGADPNGNGTIPANGASLSSWRDKANNTSVTAPGGVPTFSANFQNNLGVIRFNGASGTKFYYNTAGFSFGTSQRAVFFVIQNTGPSSGNAASPHWFWPNAGNGANALSFNTWIDANVQGTQTLLAYAASKNVFLIYSFQFGNTSGIGEVFNNGTSQGRFTKTSGGTSFADAGLGYGIGAIPADNTPQYFFDGYIAEAILYNSAVSTVQRQQVEGYLAWKWGLQGSLPANHPFKLWPPAP